MVEKYSDSSTSKQELVDGEEGALRKVGRVDQEENIDVVSDRTDPIRRAS
jgi:hypothetical protein